MRFIYSHFEIYHTGNIIGPSTVETASVMEP